ncbi:MAG: tetratricopeptide repeat protein [Myxococcales bacterium]|nr:tetratricopeptide repeat protein [Myxococcales bacterium]
MRTVMVAWCLILCAGAWAEDARKDYLRLFRQQAYPRVLQMAERTLQSAEARPAELAEAYRWQGLALAAQGKTDDAVLAFRRLLAIDPAYQLPKGTSPKLASPFFQAAGMSRGSQGIRLGHELPAPAGAGGPRVLEVELVSDPLNMVQTVRFQYWPKDRPGAREKVVQAMHGPGRAAFALPPEMTSMPVEYSFEALNEAGGVLAVAGGIGHVFSLAPAAGGMTAAVAPPPNPPKAHPLDLALPPPDGESGPLSRREASEERDGRTPWYKSFWFWTAVGVVVAGGVTGGVLALTMSKEPDPLRWNIHVR